MNDLYGAFASAALDNYISKAAPNQSKNDPELGSTQSSF